MTVNIQVLAFSSNKLQLFSYTILEDYQGILKDVRVSLSCTTIAGLGLEL